MNVLINGAGGAIGAALIERYIAKPEVDRVVAIHHRQVSSVHSKVQWLQCNLREVEEIERCIEQLLLIEQPIHRWICASGYLQGPLGGPEKSMRNIQSAKLQDDFAVNTIGPILLFSGMANKFKLVPDLAANISKMNGVPLCVMTGDTYTAASGLSGKSDAGSLTALKVELQYECQSILDDTFNAPVTAS